MNILLTIPASFILGQIDAANQAAGGQQSQAILDYLWKGGPMMIPIGLTSLVAMAVIVERMISLRRRAIIPPKFLPGLEKNMSDSSDAQLDALDYCQKDGSPIANIFAAGLKKFGEPVERLEKHIQEAGEREVLKLRKYTRLLSVIAAVAPLMGLLGTIFGMIKAFQTVSVSADALGKTELLAKGIYEAMITTAGGLMVAIPALLGFHWILGKIDGVVVEIDQMTVEFLDTYTKPVAPKTENIAPKLRRVDENDDDEAEKSIPTTAASA